MLRMSMWVMPKQVDIGQVRRGILVLFPLLYAALAMSHAMAQAGAGIAVGIGAFAATFMYGPVQRVYIAAKYATTLGTASTFLAIALMFCTAGVRAGSSLAQIATEFAYGFVSVFAILVADRMRTLWRESL
jgi:hypothetical protein